MPDVSTPDSDLGPQNTSVTSVSGGVNLEAQRDIIIGGDVVGRDKITTFGYTVEQVSALLMQISGTFQPRPFDGRCPYLGLNYFSEDDADRFFGRETLVSELVMRVKESRFVMIAGPSGSGKSSLARAGLIHALKQGALPNSDRWLYTTFIPGRDPIESLVLAMSRLAKSPYVGDFIRNQAHETDTLHKFSESILNSREQRVVILVDQFEEVFTQVSQEDKRTDFLNLLTYAATSEGGHVTVLLVMRSDFASDCATYPQLNALFNQQFVLVGAMQRDELVSAIARPALQVGLRLDPDLVAQIIDDMDNEPGSLPLMQFALKEMFDAQMAVGPVVALTLRDYLARGGLHRALAQYADRAFAELKPDENQLARPVFSGLVEIGRGRADTRRNATIDELIPATVAYAEVEAVIHKLADARLLVTDEQDNHVTVTLAHEMLIDAWPWLRSLVNENRDAIALQNKIYEDAQEWEQHQRDTSYLYFGKRLATIYEQLEARKIMLVSLAQTFIDAGIAEASKVADQQKLRPIRALRVFLCHSSGDKLVVRALYSRLRDERFDIWFDEESLWPGQEWQDEIPKAVHKSDVVIVCLSNNSINKAGYVQKEIRFALDAAEEQPAGTIFLIPLRLEPCEVPERLRRWQWVDYFNERGYDRLLHSLRDREGQLIQSAHLT